VFPAHLEGILLAIDDGRKVCEALTKLCRTDITDPGGDVVLTQVVAVMTVH
jgi:hypothetical protein